MQSLQGIKKRLEGIGSIKQITSAMELVAATKMRKAQEAALSSRPYSFEALEILANLINFIESQKKKIDEPLLVKRSVVRTAFLVVTSDKGLAGSFNGALLKTFDDYLSSRGFRDLSEEKEAKFIVVGEKGADYIKKRGGDVVKQFTKFGDALSFSETEELAEFIMAGFVRGEWDEVVSISSNFISALKQTPISLSLLPLDFNKIRKTVLDIIPETGRYSGLRQAIISRRTKEPAEYIIEPSIEEAFRKLIPLLFKMQVFHLILEANAAEHSARRFAMKSASDNAAGLLDELRLVYNRSRQEAITRELNEITSAIAAIK
jgi:F-type H+-transporting ATPase subunit gamma